jgi:hypothetical protein
MRSRKLRWALWTVAGGLLLLNVWRVFWLDVPTVSYEDYCRVQKGMSRAEVESVFGCSGSPNDKVTSVRWVACWEGCAGTAVMNFDENGKIIDKMYLPRVDWDKAGPADRQKIRGEWRQYQWQLLLDCVLHRGRQVD